MALNQKSKNIPFLLLIGLACLLYGLGYYYVETRIDWLITAVLVIGLACVIISIKMFRKQCKESKRSVQMIKCLFSLFIIVQIGIVLGGLNYLGYKYNKRWDVTQAKHHTLSKATSEILKGLSRDVRITAFHVGLPPKYLEDLLAEYERGSKGKITTEIIDPIVQIGYAAQFGNVISGKEKKVIVQSGNERRDVDFTRKSLNEDQLNNAIVRTTRKVRYAYFLSGHGENDPFDTEATGYNTFIRHLIANNVISQKLVLGVEDIPQNCDILVIAGPREHLSEEEETLIKEYLNKGGDALFLIENTVVTTSDIPLREEQLDKNPSLNSILNEWGLKIANDVVVDLSSHASGDVGSPATNNYMAHRAIVSDLDYTVYIRPRSISMISDRRKSIRLAPLVLTVSKEDSWGETDRTLKIQFDEMLDRPGPVPIAFVAWESKGETKLSDTRLIVITDSDFLTNAFIGIYSNAKMGLNAINWLSELEYQVLVDPKEIKIERLDLTSKQKRMIAFILFLMPLSIALSGVMVWLRQET